MPWMASRLSPAQSRKRATTRSRGVGGLEIRPSLFRGYLICGFCACGLLSGWGGEALVLAQGVRLADTVSPAGLSAPVPGTASPARPIVPTRGEFSPFDAFAPRKVTPAQYSEADVQNAPLFDVLIEGNTTIPSSAILQRVETRPGRPPSQRVVQEDVSRLLSLNWFFSVKPLYRITEDGPVLVFEVVERPILRSVTFVGNKKIKSAELEAHTGLRRDHGFDPATNREAVRRIEALYRQKGYHFAKVTLEQGGQSNERDVVIRIDEGKKVRVWNIKFEGNSFVSDGVLKTKLSTKTVVLWWIGGEYDHDIVANDMFALKQYYMNLGFFDVKIDVDEDVDEASGHVTVRFRIDEGRRYRVGEIELVGNEVLGESQLLKKPEMRSGQPFNARYLRKDVEGMKDQYDELGRLFAKIEPVPQFRDDDSGFVDLTYYIDEDTPRYIGTINVHIRGDHPHTQERVIRHQVTRFAKPGQLASGKSLKLAQARVMNSPIWERADPVAFDIRPVSGEDYFPRYAQRGQNPLTGEVDAWRPDWLLPTPDFATKTGELEVLFPNFGHSTLPDRLERSSAKPTVLILEDTDAKAGDQDKLRGRSLPVFDVPAPHHLVPQSPSQVEPFNDGQGMSSVGFGHSLLPAPNRKLRDSPGPPPTLAAVKSDNAGVNPFREVAEPVFRAQSPGMSLTAPLPGPVGYPAGVPVQYRGQSIDQFGNPVPQNYLYGVSPQGDPFGDALRSPTAPGFVDIYVDATEGRTGRLMFGVGVNSDAGVVGSLVLQEDNFDILRPPRSWADIVNGQAWRGAGQSFRMEAVPGNEVSRYLVSWQDPFFLGTDFSLSLSGFYYNRFFQEWTEDRLGGRIGVGYILDRYWSVGASLRLENVDMRNFPVTAPPDLLAVRGDTFLSTAGASITYDTRDSAFMPTTGHSVQFDFEQGFGEFNYPRLELTGGQYFTVWERPDGYGKHVIQLRGQVGWTGDGTPVYERFYAGGYSSFRGFEFRGVSPRESGYRVGGNFMALGSAEYLIPITASDNVRAVVFSDFGTVEEDISVDQFRVTAGFGLRLTIPAMGPAPLAFDFAWPVTKQNEDETRVFSFYIGFTR